MKIPEVPLDKIVNVDGTLNETWLSFFQNLITQLSINVNDEGYKFPELTEDEILQLNTPSNANKIVYNITTNKMMLNNAGTFENILV
jgi:hypothetical protein